MFPILGMMAALASCKHHTVIDARYSCPGGMKLDTELTDNDVLTMRMGEKKFTLTRTLSADGARYQAGEVVFWERGADALFTMHDGEQPVTCSRG